MKCLCLSHQWLKQDQNRPHRWAVNRIILCPLPSHRICWGCEVDVFWISIRIPGEILSWQPVPLFCLLFHCGGFPTQSAVVSSSHQSLVKPWHILDWLTLYVYKRHIKPFPIHILSFWRNKFNFISFLNKRRVLHRYINLVSCPQFIPLSRFHHHLSIHLILIRPLLSAQNARHAERKALDFACVCVCVST